MTPIMGLPASREQLQARLQRTGAGKHSTLDLRKPGKRKRGSENRRAIQEGRKHG